MAYQGVNQRATSGFSTDGTGETYSLGEAYPTTRGGQTFGWSVNNAGNARDRAAGAGYDRRVRGTCYTLGSTVDFRMDLSSTGVGAIRLAIGDFGNDSPFAYVQLLDGGTVFATISGSPASSSMMDAVGAVYPADSMGAGTWTISNTAITHTFTSTNFTVRLGDGTAGHFTSLAHVSVDMSTGTSGTAPGATLTGASTITAGAAFGGAAGSAPGATLTGASTISAGAASAVNLGALTTRVFKNNTGTPLANQANCTLNIYHLTTGALVLRLTGLTTTAAGRLVVSNASLVSGTTYAYELDLTAASLGRRLPTKAAT